MLSFVSSKTPKAHQLYQKYVKKYGNHSLESSSTVCVIGGDGFMLHILRSLYGKPNKIYGISSGTVGFLMNPPSQNLHQDIEKASLLSFKPLLAHSVDIYGKSYESHAINEVSIFRKTSQAIHVQIDLNDVTYCPKLVGDGVLIATPVGSSAYNYSAGGPIIPFGTPLLALSPLNPYFPHYLKSLLLPDSFSIKIKVLSSKKRFSTLTVDNFDVCKLHQCSISLDPSFSYQLLFKDSKTLIDKILKQQFLMT